MRPSSPDSKGFPHSLPVCSIRFTFFLPDVSVTLGTVYFSLINQYIRWELIICLTGSGLQECWWSLGRGSSHPACSQLLKFISFKRLGSSLILFQVSSSSGCHRDVITTGGRTCKKKICCGKPGWFYTFSIKHCLLPLVCVYCFSLAIHLQGHWLIIWARKPPGCRNFVVTICPDSWGLNTSHLFLTENTVSHTT